MSTHQLDSKAALVRLVNGVELPVAGRWVVDPGHAEVGFWGRHFLITKVRGRFTGVVATVDIAEVPQESSVNVVLDTKSVETGDQTRDDHLRSADFLDVENWSSAAYRSSSIEWDGNNGTMIGDLTIRGVTRPVELDVEFNGAVSDPWGNGRASFAATGVIDREDWGLTWNVALEAGGFLVSKDVNLEFHIELIKES